MAPIAIHFNSVADLPLNDAATILQTIKGIICLCLAKFWSFSWAANKVFFEVLFAVPQVPASILVGCIKEWDRRSSRRRWQEEESIITTSQTHADDAGDGASTPIRKIALLLGRLEQDENDRLEEDVRQIFLLLGKLREEGTYNEGIAEESRVQFDKAKSIIRKLSERDSVHSSTSRFDGSSYVAEDVGVDEAGKSLVSRAVSD